MAKSVTVIQISSMFLSFRLSFSFLTKKTSCHPDKHSVILIHLLPLRYFCVHIVNPHDSRSCDVMRDTSLVNLKKPGRNVTYISRGLKGRLAVKYVGAPWEGKRGGPLGHGSFGTGLQRSQFSNEYFKGPLKNLT